jgi:hypothetical protein
MSITGALSGGISGAIIGWTWGPWGAVIGFVVGAVVGGVAGELMKPGQPALGAPPGLQAFSYPSNTIGDPIPDVLGTTKLVGNLLYFGGERNVAVTQEVGGGGGKGGGPSKQTQVTGYKYYMSWAIGLCIGPVDELLTVFRNEDTVWSGNLLRPVSGGQETIVIPDMGSMAFFFGTDDQAADFHFLVGPPVFDPSVFIDAGMMYVADPSIAVETPPVDYHLTSRGLCWVFFQDCYIGDYNRMPTMRFVLRKTPAIAFSPHHVVQALDYNPAHALWYILHDMIGLPEAWLHEGDFAAVAATLAGEGRGISMCFSTQQSALDYLTNINGHVDVILRYGSDGKFHPKLIRDDTPEYLPLIDENAILDDPTFSRKSWIDTINELKVQYSEVTLPRLGGEVWTIDGVPWTGTIKTVGVGKDYSTIDAARDSQTDPCLFLIDPGIYTVYYEPFHHDAYIRGLGDSPSDIVYMSPYPGDTVLTTGCPGMIMYVENISAYTVGNTLMRYAALFANLASKIVVNKCILGYSGYQEGTNHALMDDQSTNGGSPIEVCFTQLIKPSGTTVMGLNKSKVTLTKVSYTGGWSESYCVGTYISDDKAADGTEGYGPAYGDFRIKYVGTVAGVGNDIKQSTADPVAIDIGNKEIQGMVVSQTIQMALFTTNSNAVWAGRQNLLKLSYPFAAVSIPVNRNAFRLEVGDCFKFSYARYGVSNMICRVLQIAEEGPESEAITFQATEDFFSGASRITEYSAPTGHGIPAVDYTVLPFTHQEIIEAPYALSPEIQLLPIACRASVRDLGFEVYMSLDGGASYLFMKRVSNLQPFGTLVGAYPADAIAIDDEVGFTIDFVQGAGTIETASWNEVFAGLRNVALLGDEIISFQSITPVSGTQYKLEGIIRGRYDTQKQDHAEGTEFYALTPASMGLINGSEIMTGAARKFKFVPYNIKASGAIAEATALDLTIAGRALTPYLPANLMANGSGFAARYDTDIVLTWSPRYRGKGAGIGLPGIVLPDVDREGLFRVEVYVSAALVRTTDAIDAATWTYTEAMNTADNGSPAGSVTFKLSNYRTESGHTYESEQTEVTCRKN